MKLEITPPPEPADGTAALAEKVGPDTSAAAAIRTATTRRRFMKLAAAGSVAMLVGGRADRAAAAAAPAKRKAAKPTPKPVEAAPDAVRQEIESQKGYLARALKTVREYPLPPGSDMAFTFQPLEALPPARDQRAGGKS